MKLYGFRPKTPEEQEAVERALREFPSTDAFVREAVLAYMNPNLGGTSVEILDVVEELRHAEKRLLRFMNGGDSE